MLVFFRQVDHDRPLLWEISPLNPDKVVEHPACRRVLEAFPLLVRKGRCMRLEGGANPRRQGGIPQHAESHHPPECHETCRLFELPRGSQKRRGFEAAKPACCLGVACIAGSEFLWGYGGVVACSGGEDDTPVLVDVGLTGGTLPGQRPFERIRALVRWRAGAGASPFGIAGEGTDGALGDEGGLHALRKGGEGLLGIGCTGNGRAAHLLAGCACLRAVLQALCVHRALRLRLARRGVEEPPALLDATIARSDAVRARARRERSPRLRIGVGQDRLGCAQGRGDTGDPLPLRLGERPQVLGTREGTVGDKTRRARGALHRCQMSSDALATVMPVTPLATAGRHQHRHASLVFDDHVQQHVGEGWSLIPTGAAG